MSWIFQGNRTDHKQTLRTIEYPFNLSLLTQIEFCEFIQSANLGWNRAGHHVFGYVRDGFERTKRATFDEKPQSLESSKKETIIITTYPAKDISSLAHFLSLPELCR
jgi:hypothetical protein